MRNLGFFWLGAVLLLFCGAQPANANVAQRQILDASINMGWATETLARDGRAATTIGDVASAMGLAQAHIRALVGELRAPYGNLDFSVVLQRLADWDRATAASDAAAATRYVQQTYDRFRETLTVYFDARTQRLVRDSNCDVFFAEVGFHFGRAHISALRNDAAAREGHLGSMRQAIRAGLQQDQLKLCGFGVPADWDLLPVLSGDTSANGFGATLRYIQEIALQAQGGAGRAVLPALIAQGGSFITAPIAGFTDEAIRAKGWTPIGKINRFCRMELACENKPRYPKDLPQCDPTGSRIVIQNRYAHNGCIAQGCEGGTQIIDRDGAGKPVKPYDAIFDTYECGK